MLRRLPALLLLLLAPGAAFADGMILVHATPVASIRGHMPYAPLEVAYHQVKVRIEGQVAFTEVDQVFVNPTAQRLEGTYVFPLPEGAQIDRFAMEIGGKEVEAELLPADKARQLYEDIVRRMRDPALLEYAGRGLFKARIFPIEPRERKRVCIRYRQLLRDSSGLVEYVYPLNTEKFSSAPIERVSVQVDLAVDAPLRTVYSSSHKVEVVRDGDRKARIAWEEKGGRPDRDFHLAFSRDAKDVGMSLLTYRPDPAQDGYFLLLASPAPLREAKDLPAKDVVFVLDTSGSMADGKLDQARKALRFCLSNLNAEDRFELVRFSTEAEPLFGSLRTADAAAREAAGAFLDRLKPIGGTAIDEALQKALSVRQGDRPFLVVFLTDGQPTVGETGEDAILARLRKANSAATRVFCLGVGEDLNTHLLDRIAEATRGSNEYVLQAEALELKLSAFFERLKAPALTQVSLAFGGKVRGTLLHPKEIPDLFRGDQLVLLGRYSGSGPCAMTLEGLLGGEKRVHVLEGGFPECDRERPWIARLWAARRVGFLLDEMRLRGETAELRDEIAALAREHGIVTPYTSYLILEDEGRRRAQGHLPQAAAPILESQAADGDGYRSFLHEKSGKLAIAGRGAADDLKKAEALAPEAAVKYAGAKAFYRAGGLWVDAEARKRGADPRKRVRFGSDEYFALLSRFPEAGPWLALGRGVEVALPDGIYLIEE